MKKFNSVRPAKRWCAVRLAQLVLCQGYPGLSRRLWRKGGWWWSFLCANKWRDGWVDEQWINTAPTLSFPTLHKKWCSLLLVGIGCGSHFVMQLISSVLFFHGLWPEKTFRTTNPHVWDWRVFLPVQKCKNVRFLDLPNKRSDQPLVQIHSITYNDLIPTCREIHK